MSLVKVIELIAEGKSIEDAVTSAVEIASETVRNIRNVYIQDMQAIVEKNKVTKYRLNVKVSFLIGK